MKGFISRLDKWSDRWGGFVAAILLVLFIIGFHGQPILWVPLVLVFVVLWIMGARADRRDRKRVQRRSRSG